MGILVRLAKDPDWWGPNGQRAPGHQRAHLEPELHHCSTCAAVDGRRQPVTVTYGTAQPTALDAVRFRTGKHRNKRVDQVSIAELRTVAGGKPETPAAKKDRHLARLVLLTVTVDNGL